MDGIDAHCRATDDGNGYPEPTPCGPVVFEDAPTCGTCIRYDATGYCTLWGRAKAEREAACRQYASKDGGKDGNEREGAR